MSLSPAHRLAVAEAFQSLSPGSKVVYRVTTGHKGRAIHRDRSNWGNTGNTGMGVPAAPAVGDEGVPEDVVVEGEEEQEE